MDLEWDSEWKVKCEESHWKLEVRRCEVPGEFAENGPNVCLATCQEFQTENEGFGVFTGARNQAESQHMDPGWAFMESKMGIP